MKKNLKKATEAITNILNNFLEDFDCEANFGTDFEYWGGNNVIFYALATPQQQTDAFLDFAKNLFPHIKADPFIWSFFHELGHNQTEEDFTDEEWAEYTHTVKHLLPGKDDMTYFNLPQEYAATYWAGEYMSSHVEEVSALWNKLAPAIQNFYKTMGVK